MSIHSKLSTKGISNVQMVGGGAVFYAPPLPSMAVPLTVTATSSSSPTGILFQVLNASGTPLFSVAADGTTTINLPISQYTNAMAQSAVGTILIDSSTIDFTYTPATPAITAIVKNNSILNMHIRQAVALSVIGNSTNALANVADIAGTANQVLRVNSAGTILGFGQVNLASSAAVTGVLTEVNGGTGQNTFAVGDILYANTTSTLARLAGVATGNALISGGLNTAPSWGKIGLTTHVSGTLGVTNGGTGNGSATQGDILYASAANTFSLLAKSTTATRYLANTGASNNPAWAQIDLSNGATGILPFANLPTTADVQTFSTPGTTTWTRPTVGSMTYIYVIGAGAGGGSGRRGATASGGGGGAGGGVAVYAIPKSLLASSETVVVGQGGAGGAAQTTNSTDGNNGVAGGDSIFRHSGTNWIIGKGGGGGGGGSTGTVSGGSVGGPCDYVSAVGGNGNTSNGGTSGTPTPQAAGPGAGGGGTVLGNSSSGGTAILPRGGINSGGNAPGGNGNSGLLSFPTGTPGGGGSGGASTGDGVTPGGNGGAGGNYGGGGGGGGGSADGSNSGAGGAGANGIVIVITV